MLFQIDIIIKVVALVYFQNTIVLKGTCVIPGYLPPRNIQIGSLIDGYIFGRSSSSLLPDTYHLFRGWYYRFCCLSRVRGQGIRAVTASFASRI